MTAATTSPAKAIKREWSDDRTPSPTPSSWTGSTGSNFAPQTPPAGNEKMKIKEEDESPKKRKKVTPKKKVSSGGKGKTGAWTGEEDWKMYALLHPKVSSPNWADIASQLGRDAKSCQNRYTILKKRAEGAIKGIAGN